MGSGDQGVKSRKVRQERGGQAAPSTLREAGVWAPRARGLGLQSHNEVIDPRTVLTARSTEGSRHRDHGGIRWEPGIPSVLVMKTQ